MWFRTILSLAVLIILTVQDVSGQTTNPYTGFTPSGLEPGGGFSLSGFDNINPATGSMNVALPLLQIGGRGQAGYTMTLRIDRHWTVPQSYINPKDPPTYDVEAKMWYESDARYKPVGLSPGMMALRWGAYKTGGTCNSIVWGFTLSRYTFVHPDGSETEFVDALTNGQARQWSGCLGTHTRGKVWYSTDGSGMTFIADQTFLEQTLAPFPSN